MATGHPVFGYLVIFGDKHNTDLSGDYFTAETDFDLKGRLEHSLYWEHGQDPVVGRRRIGRGLIEERPKGLWFYATPVPELPQKMWDAIVRLARDEQLGFSSGAPGHLVERAPGEEAKGRVAHRIIRWPLIDASLTLTPAETRILARTKRASLDERLRVLEAEYVQRLLAVNNNRSWLVGRDLELLNGR